MAAASPERLRFGEVGSGDEEKEETKRADEEVIAQQLSDQSLREKAQRIQRLLTVSERLPDRGRKLRATLDAIHREQDRRQAQGDGARAPLERALHDMRGSTEVKVSYETKMAEALQMIEMAQKKSDEAEEKFLAAKSLEADLLEEKNKLDLSMQASISREEAIIQKESILDKRESELLVLQMTIASKERAEIERLRQEQEVALVRRRQEFDTEMDIKLASFEEEIDVRKTLLDQRESAINEQEDALAQREQNLNIRLAELANKEESMVKKSDELREEEKRLSCGKLKYGGVENLKQNCVHMSPDEDKNAGPKHSIVKKLELSPVSAPIFWVRKCAQVIFKHSPEKSADPHNDGLVPAKLANVNDSSLAAAYSDGHRQLENGAWNVPQTEDGLKVGKKRLNDVLCHGDREILQPKRKQQRSTTQTFRVIGGEIDFNCPSVLEEKCSKNEHDAVPVGLCGKGPHNPQEGELVSSDDVLLVNGKSDASDVPEGDEHSEDISVSAAEPSNEDSDDEGDEEGKMSLAKIWRFLIT